VNRTFAREVRITGKPVLPKGPKEQGKCTELGRGREIRYQAPTVVARGGYPPPATTERSVQISRTTLFKGSFTAQLIAEAPDREATGSAAVTETAP